MKQKKFRRVLALLSALLMGATGLAACGGGGTTGGSDNSSGGGVGNNANSGEDCLDVYCHEAGYGTAWCKDMLDAFVKEDWVKAKYPNVKYTFESTKVEGYVKNQLPAKNANYYDLMFGVIGDTPLDNTLLEELTQDVYNKTVPGESVTFEQKAYDSYNKMNRYLDKSNPDSNRYFKTSWAGGTTGIFYNEDLLAQYGGVPRTTNELIAICNEINTERAGGDTGYAFIQSKGLSYWQFMFPQWWAQYEGVDGYYNFWNGIANDELSVDIFKQEGRLESLKVMEELLAFDKHLDPASLSYEFKVAQQAFLSGYSVFHVNGDWFENEMKDIKAELKEEDIDYSIKMMRTPIVSALGVDMGITDEKLAEIVDYVDGTTTAKPAGVTDAQIERVKEARGVVYSIGGNHTTFVPSYAKEKDIAKDFLLFMATDKAQAIYMQATGGSCLPFEYDVKTKNATLYNSLSDMQKEVVDYLNSDKLTIDILPIKEAFPLVTYGGVSEFLEKDYHLVLSMENKAKDAQTIYNDTITYWHAQRWDDAIQQAGL